MSQIESRGRPLSCKKCGYQFKIIQKNKREKWEENQSKCPVCNEKYCNKPKTERMLMVLQDEYFGHNRDVYYLNEMSKIMIDYAQSIILKFYRPYIYTEQCLNYYSNCAVSFLVEEFYKKDSYRVYASFAGALQDKIKQALFNKYEKLQEDMSIDWQFDDGHEDSNSYRTDYKRDLIDEVEEYENKKNLLKYICMFLDGVSSYCDSKYEDLLRQMALVHALNSNERYVDKIYQETMEDNGKIKKIKVYGRRGKKIFLQTMDALKLELEFLNYNR